MMSLCPDPNSPMASTTIGVTEMMDMMTMEEKTNKTIVEHTRVLMSDPDSTEIVHPFLNCASISPSN